MSIQLSGGGLSIKDLVAVARGRVQVELEQKSRTRVLASRSTLQEALASGEAVYGINTGFGKLKNHRIPDTELADLQINLLRSHAVGVGDPIPTATVRAMGLLRAESLAVGVSGVSVELIESLIDLVNRGVHPIVPQQGSVGASGDLAPLAHYALVLVGEGEAEFDGEISSGSLALERAGLKPYALGPKDGLALINGTQQSTATLALALAEVEDLLDAALAAAALSLEGALGSVLPFGEEVARVRRQPGHEWVARRLRLILAESELSASHATCDRLQDPYSLRCSPQVMGAAVDGLAAAYRMVERELSAATDNPLVFPSVANDRPWRERIVSAGNFHAQPISLAADMAAISLASISSISERRTALLLDDAITGLTPFLAQRPGVHSGLMLLQYTAAALVSENKTLSHPASVDTIPTSAGMEDHVSMAPWAARKFQNSVENARRIIAAELLCAAQAVEMRKPLRPGVGGRAIYESIREMSAPLTDDRSLAGDIEIVSEWIRKGGVTSALGNALGEWQGPWKELATDTNQGVPS